MTETLEAAIHTLAALLLLGAFLYIILSIRAFEDRDRLRSVAIGLTFGLAVAVLTLDAHLPADRIPIDGKVGPLMLGGYFGGPVGALAVAAIALPSRLMVQNEYASLPIGLFYFALFILLGTLIRTFVPPTRGQIVPVRALRLLLLGFVVVQVIPASLFAAFSQDPEEIVTWTAVITIAAASIASILVTWGVVQWVGSVAATRQENDALNRRQSMIMAHSGVGTYSYRDGDPLFHVDEGFAQIYGRPEDAGPWRAEDFLARVHPDDREDMRALIAAKIAGEETRTEHDVRVYRDDGKLLHIRAIWVLERFGRDKRVRITGLHKDLTDIREADFARTEAHDRFALILRNLPGVVVQARFAEGQMRELLYVSPNCIDFWGHSDQDLYRDNSLLRKSQTGGDVFGFVEAVAEGVRTLSPIYARVSITATDGAARWMDFHAHATPLPDGAHRIDGIFVDVTQEVKAQQALEHHRDLVHRAQKIESVGQLTGGVAHDFNNLLAVISGNMELLRDEVTNPTHLSMIKAAFEATQRGAGLTRNMLAFARRARLEPVVLDLNTVVREAQNWMSRALPASIDVETSLLAGLWPVSADRASLESALLNLILNARDAMEGRGRLTIETANVRIDQTYVDARDEEITPGRYAMLAVSDTGPGIEPDALEKIFEPFFTTKPPGAGSGLGLSMVLGFVRQSGGTVQVYTEPGQGTTFKLYFPVGADVADTAPKPRDASGEETLLGLRVLLVEDETPVADVLVTILEKAGYGVVAAASGDEARALWDEDANFDVLVTDIVMPGQLQGTHLARDLRALRPDLPVIFMSGYASEATVHGNGLRPEDIRLMKPVVREDLLDAIRRAIAAAGTPGGDS